MEAGLKHLQVAGDGVVGTVGHHQDAVGFADQAVTLLDLPRVPEGDARAHDGHSKQGVVGVIQLPVGKKPFVQSNTISNRCHSNQEMSVVSAHVNMPKSQRIETKFNI